MKPFEDVEQVIDGKRYSTKTAVLIAQGDDQKRKDREQRDRNIFLYRTPHGNFFKVHVSQHQSEQTKLEPVSEAEAIGLFELLTDRCVDLEDAFPG